MESRVIPPPQASARQTEMGEKFNRVLFSALDAMQEASIPYALIGGIAVSGLGRPRSTHDIDIFVRPEDAEASLEALAKHGFETERTDSRWLFKGWRDEMMVDIIFKSHGDIYFDTEMQSRTRLIHYHGRNIPAVSPEDLVIIKAAVHSEFGPHHWHDALAILSHAQMNWSYLIKRARRAPRRLLSLLVYAQSNDILIPNDIIDELYGVIFSQASARKDTATQTPKSVFESGMRNSHGSNGQASDGAVANQPGKLQPDAYLLSHIQERLATDSRTATADIELTIDDRTIVVRGEAPSLENRMAVEDIIRTLVTDFDVKNQLQLVEIGEPAVGEVV